MARIAPSLALFVVGLVGAVPALLAGVADAQEAASRFSLSPTPEGFLKLDGKTGVVSECKREASGYQCRLVPDEREALQNEMDRLNRENQELRDRLALGNTPPVAPRSELHPSLPSEDEADRVMSMMEKFLKRFMAIMREDPQKPDKGI